MCVCVCLSLHECLCVPACVSFTRGVISGAITSQYLLEKSRIVFQVKKTTTNIRTRTAQVVRWSHLTTESLRERGDCKGRRHERCKTCCTASASPPNSVFLSSVYLSVDVSITLCF